LINVEEGNFLAPFEKLSYNAWRTVVEIDLFGTFYTSKVVNQKCFKPAKKGNIINISATLGNTGAIL